MGEPSVAANGLSIVHQGSKGKLNCTIPDFCYIPVPMVGPVPIPFMVCGKSKDINGGTITVQIGGKSVGVMGAMVSQCKGDKGGVMGGVASGSTEGMGCSCNIMYIELFYSILREFSPCLIPSA